MFDKQYRFYGKHAKQVEALTADFDEKNKTKMFKRNLDVYMNAPIIGFLYGRKSKRDNDNQAVVQNIFPEQMINYSDTYKHTLRTIVLLDKGNEPDQDKRIDLAFKYLDCESNMELFDSYVLGGVEVLYEKLIEGAHNPVEYVENLNDFLIEFNERFNEEISNEDILALCNSK